MCLRKCGPTAIRSVLSVRRRKLGANQTLLSSGGQMPQGRLNIGDKICQPGTDIPKGGERPFVEDMKLVALRNAVNA